jgi:isochorismate synthase EntC
MNTRSTFCDFINHKFFERGAFITNPESKIVTFARGGETKPITETQKDTCFYLKDFYHNSFLGYFPEETVSFPLAEVREWCRLDSTTNLTILSSKNEDLFYARDFKNLQKTFGDELKKVVLVSCESFRLRDSIEGKKHFFSKSLTYGTGLPYGYWNSDYGVVGSSPEILFSLNDLTLKTFALAGTAPLEQGEILLKSTKDRSEHNFVITDICENLKTISHDLKIHETRLHPYRNIVHLKTDIECQLNNAGNPLALTSLLSPTAALGGYPKSYALRFLSQTEYAKRHPQRYFGSAFGLHTHDTCFAIVMIRNIQWNSDVFSIESGGGVIPESNLESEMKEIHLKRESIKGHYL